MFAKLKIAAVIALIAAIGSVAVTESASARVTQCWKGAGGGTYCY